VNIEVWWPTSNTRQNFANVQKNQFLVIHEFAGTYTRLERKSFRLGSPNRAVAHASADGPNTARKQE